MARCRQACTVRSDAGDVVERVAKLNAQLASEQGGGESVMESLRQLQGVRMTFEALEATKIGRAVNDLRKSAPSEQARVLAAELYRRWKALADDHFATTRRARSSAEAPKAVDGSATRPSSSPIEAKNEQPAAVEAMMAPAVVKKRNIVRLVFKNSRPPSGGANQQTSTTPATVSQQGPAVASSKRAASPATTAASLAKQQAKPPPPTALPKPSGSGARKRKEAPPAGLDEARLARAKARLHEGYKEAATAKEKRKIQVIAAAPTRKRNRRLGR